MATPLRAANSSMSTDAPARRTARPARGPRALTVEEAHLLQGRLAADAAAARQDLPDLVAFLLGTGLRIGEACAVRPTDLDLRRGPGAGAGLVGRRGQPAERTGLTSARSRPVHGRDDPIGEGCDLVLLVVAGPEGGHEVEDHVLDATDRVSVGQVGDKTVRPDGSAVRPDGTADPGRRSLCGADCRRGTAVSGQECRVQVSCSSCQVHQSALPGW